MFGWNFCICDSFFNLTIQVVTFRLHGLCMTGVFVPGTQDMNVMIFWVCVMNIYVCVHRLDLGLYAHPKEFEGNGIRTHVNSKGKNPLYRKNSPENPWRCIKQYSEPNTTNELFRTPNWIIIPVYHITCNCQLNCSQVFVYSSGNNTHQRCLLVPENIIAADVSQFQFTWLNSKVIHTWQFFVGCSSPRNCGCQG